MFRNNPGTRKHLLGVKRAESIQYKTVEFSTKRGRGFGSADFPLRKT